MSICLQQAYSALVAGVVIICIITSMAIIFFKQNNNAILGAFCIACVEICLIFGLLLNMFAGVCPT